MYHAHIYSFMVQYKTIQDIILNSQHSAINRFSSYVNLDFKS